MAILDMPIIYRMTIYQQLLVFRTCLAVLVVMKKLVETNEAIAPKVSENLRPIIQLVSDEVNRLYKEA